MSHLWLPPPPFAASTFSRAVSQLFDLATRLVTKRHKHFLLCSVGAWIREPPDSGSRAGLPASPNMPSSLATYCFSLFTLSVLSSKALRFLAHLYVTPLGPLLLYLPTYVVLDFIAIAVARLLFWPQARSWLSITCSTIGVFSTYLIPISPFSSHQFTNTHPSESWPPVAPRHSLASTLRLARSCTGQMLAPSPPTRMVFLSCSVDDGQFWRVDRSF